jgi:hypothetical protein
MKRFKLMNQSKKEITKEQQTDLLTGVDKLTGNEIRTTQTGSIVLLKTHERSLQSTIEC